MVKERRRAEMYWRHYNSNTPPQDERSTLIITNTLPDSLPVDRERDDRSGYQHAHTNTQHAPSPTRHPRSRWKGSRAKNLVSMSANCREEGTHSNLIRDLEVTSCRK